MPAQLTRLTPPVEEVFLPPDYTWNARALATSSSLFQMAMSFVGSTTVLPSFLAQLASPDLIIGLANGLGAGGWLLPQLIVSSAVARMPRKKPLMMLGAWLGRPIFLLIALCIWLLTGSHPGLVRVIVMVGFFGFFLSDGIGSVPWFDILARTIPAKRRGRVMGIGQVIGNLGGIGGGLVVGYVLSAQSPWAFPSNYALLFATAGMVLLAGAVALNAVREPETMPDKDHIRSTRAVLAMMPRILADDSAFLMLILTRLAAGFVFMASAFYILDATRNRGLAPEAVGGFISAQVFGSLTAGLLMGAMQDRWGPLVHIRVVLAISALSPLIGLSMVPLHASLGSAARYLYLLLYFCLGISMGSMGWPYFNWLLEYAEERWRPVYMGMMNTLGAVMMFAPTLGGWVAGISSYSVVFALALAFALLGLALSLGLPSTRRALAAG